LCPDDHRQRSCLPLVDVHNKIFALLPDSVLADFSLSSLLRQSPLSRFFFYFFCVAKIEFRNIFFSLSRTLFLANFLSSIAQQFLIFSNCYYHRNAQVYTTFKLTTY